MTWRRQSFRKFLRKFSTVFPAVLYSYSYVLQANEQNIKISIKQTISVVTQTRSLSSLFGRNSDIAAPNEYTAEDFASFFARKVDTVRAATADKPPPPSAAAAHCSLSTFHELSEADVRRLIMSSSIKSSTLDPDCRRSCCASSSTYSYLTWRAWWTRRCVKGDCQILRNTLSSLRS